MESLILYVSGLTESKEIDGLVLQCAVHAAMAEGRMPTRAEIAETLLKTEQYECIDTTISRTTVLRIMDRLLSWQMIAWECEFVTMMYQFFVASGRLPSMDELIDYTHVLDDTIFDENKVYIGADISQFRTSEPAVVDTACGLCYGDIAGPHYRLPCGHCYHVADDECLEGTVKRWFQKNAKCPMCRADMRDHGAPTISDT